jgi:hypothetical protein
MTLLKTAAIAAMTLSIAGPALAQPSGAQPSGASPLANDGPYAGTSRKDFYKPSDRIAHLQSEIQQGVLPGAKARQVMAQLTEIHQDLKFRVARHNGSLLDWDRELINQKLDALVKRYPALGA